MKKWELLFLCLLLLLAGCSQGEAGEPEEKETEAGEISTDLSERHLPLYEMLGHYNEYDYFDGFTVSEVEREGRLSYQFTRQDADVCLLMDETGEAELSIGGETTAFTTAFMPAGGSTGIHWTDLTGDGDPEFIYTEHWNGTGFHPNRPGVKFCVSDIRQKSRMALESRADSGMNPLNTESHGGQNGMRTVSA